MEIERPKCKRKIQGGVGEGGGESQSKGGPMHLGDHSLAIQKCLPKEGKRGTVEEHGFLGNIKFPAKKRTLNRKRTAKLHELASWLPLMGGKVRGSEKISVQEKRESGPKEKKKWLQ